MKHLSILLFSLSILSASWAQQVQTIRGRVTDRETKMPLPGANIIIVGSDPLMGTTSDIEGYFRLDHVPQGRQSVKVSYVGYKSQMFQSLILQSAKEMVLEAELEEEVVEGKLVEIKAEIAKTETRNQMATVSARTFTVEETEKFAGSRGDVARMAMNFAGVSSANDQRNDIIIRGNSPSGLLWRLEGIDIPNPNHFAEGGTTGGPVGMLNNNLLQNSDFFTGAFPAEYGNAMSGVFDLSMRNGNNQKHEQLFQVGFNGFELGAEGPFSKKHSSSYLANFRYSTLELMDGIIDVGTTGVPKYKDFSFKLNFPVKKGRITIFGLGGISEISMLDSKNGNEQDLYSDEGQDLVNRSNMGAGGISYLRFLDDRSYMKISFSGVYQDGGTTIDTLDLLGSPHPYIDHNYAEFKVSASGFVNRKFSSKLSGRAGLQADRMGFDLFSKVFDRDYGKLMPLIDYKATLADGMMLYQPYVQASWKMNNRFTLIPGLHLVYFGLNNSFSLEPRIAASWQPDARQKFSLGYGLHSRTQPLSAYGLGTRLSDGSLVETNHDLGMTRSHQVVAGYELNISKNTRIKTESYFQYIFDVPVQQRSTSFSMLNTGASWGVGALDSLVNEGTGTNFGLEFTVERFFSKGIYYLGTVSLFDSKYKGSDGVERNTAFNGNYVINALFGKEFTINKKSAFTIDLKATFAGGKRYSPVDLKASKDAGTTVYDDTKAFSLQFDPFFKADFKLGYRLNGKRVSQEWQFYVENFTDHKNVLMQTYSKSTGEVKNVNQLGVFPMMQYRIHF